MLRAFAGLMAVLCGLTVQAQVSFRSYPEGEPYNLFTGASILPARWTTPTDADSTQITDFAIVMAQMSLHYDWLKHPRFSTGPAADLRFGFAFVVNTGARLGWSVGFNDNCNQPRSVGVRFTGGYDLAYNPQNRLSPFYVAPYAEGLLVFNGEVGSIQLSFAQTFPQQLGQYARVNMIGVGFVGVVGDVEEAEWIGE